MIESRFFSGRNKVIASTEKGITHGGGKKEILVPQQLIRGHHLPFYGHIVEGFSPQEVSKAIVDNTLSEREPLTEKQITWFNELPYKRGNDALYAYDVIGVTDEEAKHNENGLAETFTAFEEMDDSAPIKIVDGQKDGICTSCIHGKHCSVSVGDGDREFVRAFVNVAKMKGHGDALELSEEEVTFTDKELPVKSMSVTTTAEVVRDVLTGDALKETLAEERNARNIHILRKLGNILNQ